MENLFIKLIQSGKIKNLEELKKAFRKVAKRTHPDIVGSDQFINKFILFKSFFEEAKQFLKSDDTNTDKNKTTIIENYRFLFFKDLKNLDTLELPRYQNKKIVEQIKQTKESIAVNFKKWKPDYYKLFLSANNQYEQIKNEKYINTLANLRKPSLYKNLRPVFFNLTNYHITGINFYKKQLKRNLENILKRLKNNNYHDLKKFILFLIEDMEKGPAVFG
jgi:hypothetical protein